MKSAKFWFPVLLLGIFISFQFTIKFFENMAINESEKILLQATAIFMMICTYGFKVIQHQKKELKKNTWGIRIMIFVLIFFSICASGGALWNNKENAKNLAYVKDEGYKTLLDKEAREVKELSLSAEQKKYLSDKLKLDSSGLLEKYKEDTRKEYQNDIEKINNKYNPEIKKREQAGYYNHPSLGSKTLKIQRDRELNVVEQKINKIAKEKVKNFEANYENNKKLLDEEKKSYNDIKAELEETTKLILEYQSGKKISKKTGYDFFLTSVLGKGGFYIASYLYLIIAIVLEILILQLIEYVFNICKFNIFSYFSFIFAWIGNIKFVSGISRKKLMKAEMGIKAYDESTFKKMPDQEIIKEVAKHKRPDKTNKNINLMNNVYKEMKKHYKNTGKILSIEKLSKTLNKSTTKIRAARKMLEEEGKLKIIGKKGKANIIKII
jgi:hypothetical protein